MRYLNASIQKATEERIYRIYVTDSLYLQGQNKYPAQRFAEIYKPKQTDTRKAEEIASDVFSGMGLQVL